MNFDEKSATWDNENRRNRAKVVANEIRKGIAIKKNYNALEFGCGTGLVSFNLCKDFIKITLVDNSLGMINTLNANIAQSAITNMTGYCLDIFDQDLLVDKFDVIYTSMALHHIPEIEKVLRKLYELLNVGGSLCIIDLDEEDGSFHSDDNTFDGHNGFNQTSLMHMMEKIGLKENNSHNFYEGIRVIGSKEIDYTLFLCIGKK